MLSATSNLSDLNKDLGDNAINLTTTRDRLAELPTLTSVYGSKNKTGGDHREKGVAGAGKDADIGLEAMKINEGSRDSGFTEKNSNTNGSVHAIDLHDNTNDNRHHLADGPIIKKIKQIKMEETPLHLTGLSLSGSGVQLYVKIDDHSEKVAAQKPTVMQVSRPGRPKKTIAKSKKTRDTNHVGAGDRICKPNTATTYEQPRCEKTGFPKEGQKIQTNDVRLKDPNTMQDTITKRPKYSYDNMETAEQRPVNNHRYTDKHSEPNKPRPSHQQVTQSQQSRFPYGCNQNFQSTLAEPKQNVIKGPIWNVENGRIDVIKSHGNIPSTSRPQTSAFDNYDDDCVDYTTDHFESKDLPLKRRRRNNSPTWQRPGSTSPYNTKRHRRHHRLTPERETMSSSDDDDDDDDEDDDNMDDICEDNGNNLVREDSRKRKKDKKRQHKKMGMKTELTKKPKASRSEEDVKRNPKHNDSELSHGEQSSIGPQFDTSLLPSHSLDAETLMKFTEYTQALRKDLKQKYKDLSKLLRSFEDAAHGRNNNQTDNTDLTVPQDGRCRVM